MTNIKATIKAKKSAMILENPVTMSQIVNNLLIRIGHLRMDQYFFPRSGVPTTLSPYAYNNGP